MPNVAGFELDPDDVAAAVAPSLRNDQRLGE